MLLELQGEKTGSIIMFDDIAIRLLKMMGQSGNSEGAVREADVPAALDQLKQSLAGLPGNNDPEVNSANDNNEPEVSIHTRAAPLIDLLEHCISKGGYFMWKPQ